MLKKKSYLSLAVLAVILLVGVLYRGVQRIPRSHGTGAGTPPPATPVTPRGPASPASQPPTSRARVAASDKPGIAGRAQQALEEYRKFAVYPPWSRPADGSQVPTLNWNAATASGPQPLVASDKAKTVAPGQEKEPPIFAELSLDRMFAGPGQPIVATLSAWRGSAEAREPVQVQVDANVEMWTDKEGWAPVAKVRFSDGQARVVPSEISPLTKQGGDVRLAAHVRAGARAIDLVVPFRYATDAAVVVHGLTDSRIRDGSLDVELDLDVRTAGALRVEGVLASRDGARPIAVYTGYLHPEPGRQRLTITFFGRIINEAGLDGPYQVQSLHGLVVAPQGELFWEADGAYETGSFQAADFSAAEWSSPEKDAKIRQYERLIQQ